MIFEGKDAALAVAGVAFAIAVAESRFDLSQITRRDRLAAGHADGLRAGCPAIDQDEFHVEPPNAKQYTVSDEGSALGGGAQRWFLPSGLSLFRSTFWGGTEMYFPSSLRFA
jgi:hypothetical protein